MRHLILCSVMWLCGLMMAAGQNVPQVIPALQQWKSAKGKLVLPEKGKVIISPDEAKELKEGAEILVQDLKDMFGWDYRVVKRSGLPGIRQAGQDAGRRRIPDGCPE